ncbi:hypothetical protein MKW94_003413 [Papaver nudicaule]|uniref:Uncharacterized protein n=1 Tax=Papaver nudicaule TaxID=74823 RepID=A0AA41VFA3_PAPNU|nr:hypothetical protein [Papaver nudicaule]
MVDVLGSVKQQGLFLDKKCGDHLLSNFDGRSSRNELLRARFSDTIKKADLFCRLREETNETVRIHEEKKFLEKLRLEQRAKNRAAAEMASRKDREAKLQRQRDRAAARRKLEEMEKNVVVDDWHKTYKDFLMLINSK